VAASGVVITQVAFDTGHSSGIDGRLSAASILAVAVSSRCRDSCWAQSCPLPRAGLASNPSTGHYCDSGWSESCRALVVAVVVIHEPCCRTAITRMDRCGWRICCFTQTYVPLR